LSDEREKELLEKQIECNFIWTNKEGHGRRDLNYVARNVHLADSHQQRARIKALRRDPRASVVISSMGTDMGPGKQITYKGRSSCMTTRPPRIGSTPPWPRSSARIPHLRSRRPSSTGYAAAAVLEFVPEKAIKFDGDAIASAPCWQGAGHEA